MTARPETRAIQDALRALGYDPGPSDGRFGLKTRRGAEAWIRAGGEPAPERRPPPPAAVSGRQLRQGSRGHLVTEIVVHCSATQPEWMDNAPLEAQREEIARWHRAQGWRAIGYHWLLGRRGQVLPGRAETEIGAGVIGRNTGVIHVCLVGGFGSASSDDFRDHFTAAQAESLADVIGGIRSRASIRRISGHNEWASKACPGFFVPEALPALGIPV